MASRATGAKLQPVAAPEKQTGNWLLVVVGLATVFMVVFTLLNVAKSGPLFTESNLLFGTLIFYAASAALYIGFGVSGNERHVKMASILMIIGFLANTAAAGHRWYMAGHPPFASIYEMLLSFVWTVALLTQLAERKFGVKLIGSVTMPLAVTAVILMHLLDSDVHPLVPALQSTWLHVHVTLAMLAYAACALSFALSIMYLIKDRLQTETFLAITSGLTGLIYVSILATRFERGGDLSVVAWNAKEKSDLFFARGQRVMVGIPDLGWLMVLVTVAVLAPLALYAIARIKKQEGLLEWANRIVFVSMLLQVFALASFAMRANNQAYTAIVFSEPGVYPTALAASPFILSGLISGIFVGLLYMMMYWRRTDLERMLPEASVLDRVTYKTIMIAFPLLTLMIAAGAYWANRTWGSYWSWDPKETWALITWLVYALYLHMRVTKGMRGRVAAYFSIIGFAVVMFTFFGVTYLLPGLHAYA
jgi:cytochrome c-type biogenesis protein CcsB